MEAKHFKKIRSSHTLYSVDIAVNGRGHFDHDSVTKTVLGRTPIDAVKRVIDKGFSGMAPFEGGATKFWAAFQVRSVSPEDSTTYYF